MLGSCGLDVENIFCLYVQLNCTYATFQACHDNRRLPNLPIYSLLGTLKYWHGVDEHEHCEDDEMKPGESFR
ncbi:hypothetical protein OKW46_000846 [Paraburkholderia sp. WSM4179]|nr:hypothetical protein [Paraburkholderia sp. WSM4179]